MKYYVDTCIFLNVWKNEAGPNKRRPLCESSEEFLKNHEKDIVISDTVIFELMNTVPLKKFLQKVDMLKKMIKIETPDHIMDAADRFQKATNHAISYGDAIHALLAKAYALTIVSRDKELLKVAAANGLEVLEPY